MTWTAGRNVSFAPDFPVKAGRVGTLVPPERQGPKRTPPKLPVHDPLRYNFIPSRRGIVMQEVREMVLVFADPDDWGVYRPTLFKLLKRAVFNEICHIEGFDPDISLHAKSLAEDITRIMLVSGTPEFVVAGAISVQRVVMQCHDRIDEGIYLGGDIFRGIDELADDLLRIKGKFCTRDQEIYCSPGTVLRLNPQLLYRSKLSACTLDTRMNDCVSNDDEHNTNHQLQATAQHTADCGPTGSSQEDVCPIKGSESSNNDKRLETKDNTGDGNTDFVLLSSAATGNPVSQISWGHHNFEAVTGCVSPTIAGENSIPSHSPNPIAGLSPPAVQFIANLTDTGKERNTEVCSLMLSDDLQYLMRQSPQGRRPPLQIIPAIPITCKSASVPLGRCGGVKDITAVQYLYGLVPVHGLVCHPGQQPQLVVTGWQWAPLHLV